MHVIHGSPFSPPLHLLEHILTLNYVYFMMNLITGQCKVGFTNVCCKGEGPWF